MRFIYLYDAEQFGQKCNLPCCNNVAIGKFMIWCPNMPDKHASQFKKGTLTRINSASGGKKE